MIIEQSFSKIYNESTNLDPPEYTLTIEAKGTYLEIDDLKMHIEVFIELLKYKKEKQNEME